MYFKTLKMISQATRKFAEPIKKRWVYHFIVSPKTNAIDKPEWYLQQTNKWIYQYIDRIGEDLGERSKYEFILFMIELVCDRLSKDIKEITPHLDSSETERTYEAILVHTYNEVVAFVKFLRQLLGEEKYFNLEEKYDLMSHFYDQNLFERITDVEWEHAVRILEEEIFELDDAWQRVLSDDYVDPYKIPKCVDKFLMLISSISERVECMKQSDCQFKLIELQCYLIEKFLKFLRKSVRPTSSPATKGHLSSILNLRKAILTYGFNDSQESDTLRANGILHGTNILRLVLKTHSLIPESVRAGLDDGLKDRINKLARGYTELYDHLSAKHESQRNPSAGLEKLKSM